MKTKILANGQELEVDTAPRLSVFVHPDDINLEVTSEDVVEINPEGTVACANDLTEAEWSAIRQSPNFLKLWKCVFSEMEVPAALKGQSLGVRHVAGMILLLAKTMVEGKRPFLRLPETYLHPKSVLGITDMLMQLTGNPADPSAKV